jgi:twitching motility two-component system response regulator PilH
MKVILVSSKTQESDRFWGMRQGADEYLTKPVDAQELITSVGKYF